MRHLPRSPRFLVLFCNNQSKVAIGSSPPIVHICVNSLESAGLPAPATNAILQPVTDWTNRWAIPGCVHRSPQTSCARCLETRWADRGKSAAVRRPGDCFQHGSRPPLSGYLAPPPAAGMAPGRAPATSPLARTLLQKTARTCRRLRSSLENRRSHRSQTMRGTGATRVRGDENCPGACPDRRRGAPPGIGGTTYLPLRGPDAIIDRRGHESRRVPARNREGSGRAHQLAGNVRGMAGADAGGFPRSSDR